MGGSNTIRRSPTCRSQSPAKWANVVKRTKNFPITFFAHFDGFAGHPFGAHSRHDRKPIPGTPFVETSRGGDDRIRCL
jgi:hypothetical protein